MIEKAIDRILRLATPAVIERGERDYSTIKLYPIEEPTPATLLVHTLTGIVDFIDDKNLLLVGGLFLHVEAPERVSVRSYILNPWEQRKCYLRAEPPESHGYPFGHWLDLETFIIELQAKFVADETTEKLLTMVSSIKDEKVKTSNDDGHTQTVTARAGIALVAEAKVPNPVWLRPYRTFNEVEQSISQFVFRLRSGDSKPMASLHEADGGQWRLEAIQNIKAYLVAALPNVPVIA